MNTREIRLESTLGNRYRSKNRLIGVKSTAKNAAKAKGIRIDFPMMRIKITTINKDKTAKALRYGGSCRVLVAIELIPSSDLQIDKLP
jgi:hypothetical protein